MQELLGKYGLIIWLADSSLINKLPQPHHI